MAVHQHYVDTDVSPGGDGSPGNPFASLAEWEATVGADNSATDDYIVDCAGVTPDTTQVTVDFSTNITTGSITIRGNRSDPRGFYSGPMVISDQHYRLSAGNVLFGIRMNEPNTIIDGIQVVAAHTGSSGTAITTGAYNGQVVRNCRVLNTASTDFGIGSSAALGFNGTKVIENNLVVGFDVEQINARVSNFWAPTFDVLHNTCYGDGSSVGIQITKSGTSGEATFNVVGNAIANNSTDIAAELGPGTLNSADNATSDSTGQITGISAAAAWTSPGTSASSDFTVKDASSPLYQAVNPTVVTTDITGFTRDGTNHDAGCFELQVGGGAVTLTIADATHGHTVDGGLVLTQQHQLAIAEATHGHSADNLTLSTEASLDIAEAAHAHAADNLTLTQQHQLAIAEATHAHIADNLTLSTESALAIADALHAHTADGGLVLTQQHVLAVADALHAHGVDNLTLLAGNTLAIAEAVHAHLADNLDLTQAHVLAIMEAIHAHTVDNVVLALAGAELPPGHLLRVPGECRLLVVLPESRVLQVH